MRVLASNSLLSTVLALLLTSALAAQNANETTANVAEVSSAETARKPFGHFVTVESLVDDGFISRLTNLTQELQTKAALEKRQAILVLEISSGSSRQGQIHDLARVLLSPDLNNVRTVAWIPKNIDGNHAILALACHDIFMPPTAIMGDIGRGRTLSDVEQNFVLDMVGRGRNLRVTRAIAKALMDPSSTVLRVTTEDPQGQSRQLFLTDSELRDLQNRSAVIAKTERIKDPGQPALFSGSDAARAGFLVAGTPSNRNEVIAALNLPLEAMRELGSGDAEIVPRVIAVNGVIGKLLADFIERETQRAAADGANMIIYDIDSPGGDKDYAQNVATVIAELDPAKVTTVAWVGKSATQAGAIVALSCDRIFMGVDASIGDIDLKAMRLNNDHTLEPAEELDPESQQRLLTVITSIAQRKNRSISLIQAMADSSMPVFEVTHKESGRVAWMNTAELEAQHEDWVKGAAIPEAGHGELLLLDAEGAHHFGLTELPCHDFEQLRTRLGITTAADLRPVAKTWVDNLVIVLNSSLAGFLLITIGIICMYIEAHLPSGLFLIGAVTSFALFFWSRFLGGSAGGLELMLFVLGMVLLGIEFFVIPGFGVFGISGILMTFASLIMASNTFAGMTATESFEQSMNSLGSLAAALIVVIAVAASLNRFLPSIPFINRLILTPPGYAIDDENAPRLKPSITSSTISTGTINVGMVGTTASSLRPTGKALFGDQYVDVVSDGAYVDHGTRIEVTRLAGNRIIVRPAKETS